MPKSKSTLKGTIMLHDFILTIAPAHVIDIARAINATYPGKGWYFDGDDTVVIPNVSEHNVFDAWAATEDLNTHGICVEAIHYITD